MDPPERQKYRSLRDIYAQLDREEAAARVQDPNPNQEDAARVQDPNPNQEDAARVQDPNPNDADDEVQIKEKEGQIEDAWQFFDRSHDGHLTLDELEKRGYFSLFEQIITDEDCIHARLEIPHGLDIDHFNFTPHLLGGVSTAEILVRDRSNKEWGMSVLKIEEDIYFTRGWSGFADWHNLEGGDRLRCFKQDNSHFYLIHTEFEVETVRIGGMPQSFLDANLLWKKTFDANDKGSEHICIDGIDLKLFFTDQSIVSSAKFKAIRFKVTDETNREWCLKLVPLPEYDDVYGLNSDFVSFCSAVKLSLGDEICFYKPTAPTHSRHFLFRIVERN